MNTLSTLSETLSAQPFPMTSLGWKPFFQQQLTLDDYDHAVITRVIAHHRNGYTLVSEEGEIHLPLNSSLPPLTVGDWVLLNQQHQLIRYLDRRSLFKRKASGSKVQEQLIAANIDTVFIVCSLNYDFNLSRIERYLALAHEAEVEPVVVLTKVDLCNNSVELTQQVQKIAPLLMIERVNSLDPLSVSSLMKWCGKGQTVTFLGSSGVGKSTLINTLLGQEIQLTGSVREDDSKGRHTTTARSVHLLPSGGILIDTPGMRELQLVDCEQGVSTAFADIESLATACQFGNCQHQTEPGCAVQQAIDERTLPLRRLESYQKLLREQAYNTATIAERRAEYKRFGKMVRSIAADKRKRKAAF